MTTRSTMVSSSRELASASRCPGCGEPLDSPPPPSCPLCAYQFNDTHATGADVTPYAVAYGNRKGGWWRMAYWVWTAGAIRLKHLALLRPSAASRQFARRAGLVTAFTAAVVESTRAGWLWVGARVDASGATVQPTGQGWVRVASQATALPATMPTESPSELWWNPAQTLVAFPVGFVAALLLLLLLAGIARSGVTFAHPPTLRPEQRMIAALRYGMAWCPPLLLATLISACRPIALVSALSGWKWFPGDEWRLLVIGTLAGVGGVAWWFWLVRLGSSAPPNARRRVVAVLAVGLPMSAVAAVVGWWYGLAWLHGPMFRLLGMGP